MLRESKPSGGGQLRPSRKAKPPWYPEGWRAVWDAAAVRRVLGLARYGTSMMRVGELGLVDGSPVALVYLKPGLRWLIGHFLRKTILRHVEPIEICAQAALILALAEGRIEKVTGISFFKSSHEPFDEDRLRPITPGQTVTVMMKGACFSYTTVSEGAGGTVKMRAEWSCAYGCTSLRPMGVVTGAAFLWAKKGPNYSAEFGAQLLALTAEPSTRSAVDQLTVDLAQTTPAMPPG